MKKLKQIFIKWGSRNRLFITITIPSLVILISLFTYTNDVVFLVCFILLGWLLQVHLLFLNLKNK